MDTLIRVEHVSLSYGDRAVMQDFSLDIPDRGLTVLAGPSGCGKTTLLCLLAGLERPETGRVTGIRGPVSILFQEDRLFPRRTVEQQLTDVLPRQRRKEVERWLELAQLRGEEKRLPQQLSGGMGRRLALVRALALGGGLYLLDEPFAGVDLDRAERILARLRELNRPILLTGHTPQLANLCDREIELA